MKGIMKSPSLFYKCIQASLLCLVLLSLIIATALYAEESGDEVRGKAAFWERPCRLCHSINNEGGAIGPALTQVTLRRDEKWLLKWLKDPLSVLADADMEKVPWKSEQEVLDIISYLKSLKTDVKNNISEKYPAAEAGKILVNEYDCKACHIMKGEDGLERYPDLTHVGAKLDAGTLDPKIKEHQVSKEGTFIPEYRTMTDEERKAIVRYLETLK